MFQMDYDNIALVNEREANSFRRSLRSFAVQPSKAISRGCDSDTPTEALIPLDGSALAERDGFEGIVGCSQALSEVLQQVREVAPTDSTVLIEGETGTGKELIARAIRAHSRRRTDAFVKMNCAAIPRELIESEIFGHEKGAFTGAVARKIGRFKTADGGTLFLDEIGDMPLDMQAKLLRVLQEQEFERVGSTSTLRVDVRVVAATNQDLTDLISQKQFRSDLYYRLRVFPITIPPLRHRREDIPLLVAYFVSVYAQRMNKHIEKIPVEAMEALLRHDWPGNIRELQNFMERSVILTTGCVLNPPVSELLARRNSAGPITMKDCEREHILRAIQETDWVIGGPHGAAARLGLPRSTLMYRMRKLAIVNDRSLPALPFRRMRNPTELA
jgi:formate hydrogenlyase transcriptional activator